MNTRHVDAIREFLESNPDKTRREIAAALKLDPNDVSQAIQGLRKLGQAHRSGGQANSYRDPSRWSLVAVGVSDTGGIVQEALRNLPPLQRVWA